MIWSLLLFLDTFGLMLDQVPSELSTAGAKRGVPVYPLKQYHPDDPARLCQSPVILNQSKEERKFLTFLKYGDKKRFPPCDGEEEAKSEFSSFLSSRSEPLHNFRQNHKKTSQYHIITFHYIMISNYIL